MEQTGGNLASFLTYGAAALLAIAVAWALVVHIRKQKRQRKAAARAARDSFRAWRDGISPAPPPQVSLGHKNSR